MANCQVCSSKEAKYTCPGCSVLSCSVSCSKDHKKASGCQGVRNKAAYVPMKDYGWGTMMNDYVFLEDMGRRIADCGMDIAKGGYAPIPSTSHTHTRQRPTRGKRDILKSQLEARDIDMDVLPSGMERYRQNQSMWDYKKQTAFLTLEFKFHRPPDPLNPHAIPDSPYTILCHRNNAKQPLLSILRSAIRSQRGRKREPCPDWVKSMVVADDSDPGTFSTPHFLLVADQETQFATRLRARPKKGYFRLDPHVPLLTTLKQKHFVEFPCIDIWEEFQGRVLNSDGIVTQDAEQEDELGPLRKRPRLSLRASKKAMNSMLGEYGSDSESDTTEHPTGLDLLGNYAASDEEERPEQENEVDGGSDSEGEVDPATLLRLLQKASHRDHWGINKQNEEEEVDWSMTDGEK